MLPIDAWQARLSGKSDSALVYSAEYELFLQWPESRVTGQLEIE